ncbi:iron-dependent peroxidase [Mycolicibacterium chitae]|uniref:Dyp-type peroxidase family protein n=1 Tax=Mycolicibacterium chitae TaxID=1792 RepID=A0A3S4TK86_MYCCI|nr:Dyp-type peroxidase [Mycolicibacterium chitae]MCV7104772.1 Dyp-type peroxidase [Mycolicibacterium chitae]BBZ03305.1 iron-dependent peroxidase [Mycolicibacterium chitae]VEG46718.1 Dyp-type peroxidase family protein [Mycolicibacterium chitae]
MAELSRRRLLGAGALVAGTAGAAAVVGPRLVSDPATGEAAVEPFYGPHQGGVATVPQRYATLLAFDLRPEHRTVAGLRSIMKLWTADAARLTQGLPALADTEPELATSPARLTVTVGYGPTLFDALRLTRAQPATLRELPAFSVDRLEPRWGGGHLVVQLCADSPLPVSHAVRVLTKNVRSMATVRWIQRGFREPIRTEDPAGSMRNLMGQVDGTVNLAGSQFDQFVWDHGEDQDWFAGGTILIVRRIRAEMDTWDQLGRDTKELVVGRTLGSGAPLTGHQESDEPDFDAHVGGIPVIPPNSHIALARHHKDSEQFLRRPYNYDDPPPAGQISDSGLLFLAFQRDPAAQFVPVQQRISDGDALNEWVTPVGSASFAVLPGVREGEYLGQRLLDAVDRATNGDNG